MASTPQTVAAQPTKTPLVKSHHPGDTKKRPIDSVNFQDSPYSKMRLLVKDLRPLFLEVLHTSDFQCCKGAQDIQEKMKLMLDLCKQMTVETAPLAKCSNTQGSRALLNEKQDGQELAEHQQEAKPAEQTQVDRTSAKPVEDRNLRSGNNSEEQLADNNTMQGTYIVGGSAFGWNFITFNAGNPVYYGRSKESFHAAK
ncbi:hypothetical protein Ancab_037038 [Ancistrocladus abbreviatus]